MDGSSLSMHQDQDLFELLTVTDELHGIPVRVLAISCKEPSCFLQSLYEMGLKTLLPSLFWERYAFLDYRKGKIAGSNPRAGSGKSTDSR